MAEPRDRYKHGDLVYYQSFNSLGRPRKSYATIVGINEFIKYYEQIYGLLYGREQAQKVLSGKYTQGTMSFIQWHSDGSVAYFQSALLKQSKPRLPEYLW